MISSEIMKAIGYLIISVVTYTAYQTATNSSDYRYKTLLKGLLICSVLAFFASITLGQPTCIDSDTDNRGTTCNEYADDGYTPTTEQRVAKFAYFMTLLGVPVTIGAFNKKVKEKENI